MGLVAGILNVPPIATVTAEHLFVAAMGFLGFVAGLMALKQYQRSEASSTQPKRRR